MTFIFIKTSAFNYFFCYDLYSYFESDVIPILNIFVKVLLRIETIIQIILQIILH